MAADTPCHALPDPIREHAAPDAPLDRVAAGLQRGGKVLKRELRERHVAVDAGAR